MPVKWIKNGPKNTSQKVIVQVDQSVNAVYFSCISEGGFQSRGCSIS